MACELAMQMMFGWKNLVIRIIAAVGELPEEKQ